MKSIGQSCTMFWEFSVRLGFVQSEVGMDNGKGYVARFIMKEMSNPNLA